VGHIFIPVCVSYSLSFTRAMTLSAINVVLPPFPLCWMRNSQSVGGPLLWCVVYVYHSFDLFPTVFVLCVIATLMRLYLLQTNTSIKSLSLRYQFFESKVDMKSMSMALQVRMLFCGVSELYIRVCGVFVCVI